MQQKNIYIDEFGNAHLDLSKKGTFSHFVYSSIIIDKSNLDEARETRNRISNKYFQGKHIKSSNISNNDKGFRKRLEILEELLTLKFDIVAIVVNKKELESLGLKRKEVFYKYYSKLLIEQFPKAFISFQIYADRLGHTEFQSELITFINTKATQTNLFYQDRSFTLVDDTHEEPLIQIADFISGCLGKIYCNSHSHPRANELFDMLYKRLNVDFAPFEKTDFSIGSIKENNSRNAIINRLGEISAIEVLRHRRKSLTDETTVVLEYLYMIHRSTPSRLISKFEIIERVQNQFPSFSERTFRQSIQHLRDLGVIITSIQGKSGYKLPNTLSDIIGFYKRYMDSIVPMLNRIDLCNKKLVWNDIILEEVIPNDENYALLTELIESVKKRKLAPQLELN